MQDVFKFLVSLKQFIWTSKIVTDEFVAVLDCILYPHVTFINLEIRLLLFVQKWH